MSRHGMCGRCETSKLFYTGNMHESIVLQKIKMAFSYYRTIYKYITKLHEISNGSYTSMVISSKSNFL